MMILSGAMFSFDKLNPKIGRVDKVPFLAEIMVTKWGFEALMVHQFKDNMFAKEFYELERLESMADFKKVYYLPEMRNRLSRIDKEIRNINQVDATKNDLILLIKEIKKENKRAELIKNENQLRNPRNGEMLINPVTFENIDALELKSFNLSSSRRIYEYLKQLDSFYSNVFQLANRRRQNKINYLLENQPERYQERRNRYFNENIADILKKVYEKNKLLEYKHQLIQHIDPVYEIPIPASNISFRTHFFAPKKHFAGKYFDTYWFNMIVIWILTSILYVFLYFDVFRILLSFGENLKRK
ncbi:hypothetical protein ES705_50234 [subsurface metagenome]